MDNYVSKLYEFDIIGENLERSEEILTESAINFVLSIQNKFGKRRLELLNKRAVFVYLRDISNLSPKQLSVTMSKIRKHYREISDKGDFFLFFGDLKFSVFNFIFSELLFPFCSRETERC